MSVYKFAVIFFNKINLLVSYSQQLVVGVLVWTDFNVVMSGKLVAEYK